MRPTNRPPAASDSRANSDAQIARVTAVRLLPVRRSLRGGLAFVFFDSQGHGCPIELHRRAWRPFIYRPPVLS